MTDLPEGIRKIEKFLKGEANINSLTPQDLGRFVDYCYVQDKVDLIPTLSIKLSQFYCLGTRQIQYQNFLLEALCYGVALILSPYLICQDLPQGKAFKIIPAIIDIPAYLDYDFSQPLADEEIDLIKTQTESLLSRNAPAIMFPHFAEKSQNFNNALCRNGTSWDMMAEKASFKLFLSCFELGYFSVINCLFEPNPNTPLLNLERSRAIASTYQQPLAKGWKALPDPASEKEIVNHGSIAAAHYIICDPAGLAGLVEDVQKAKNKFSLIGIQKVLEKFLTNLNNLEKSEALCQKAESSPALEQVIKDILKDRILMMRVCHHHTPKTLEDLREKLTPTPAYKTLFEKAYAEVKIGKNELFTPILRVYEKRLSLS